MLTLWSLRSPERISLTDVLLMDVPVSPSGLVRSAPDHSSLLLCLPVQGERQRVGAMHAGSVLQELTEALCEEAGGAVEGWACAGSVQGLGDAVDL